MTNSLRKELSPFSSRPPLSQAFTALIESAARLLELRMERSFFEIDAIQTTDGSGLVDLIKALPPCPIIQPTDDGEEIFYLSNTELDSTAATSLGVTQAALQFAAPHFSLTKIVPTSALGPTPCRFFGSCKSPQTTVMPERCTNRPWESYEPSKGEQCWYGQGVAGGRSKHSGPGNTDSA